MKRCLAVLLSVWLLMTSVLPVSASGNYNDDQFDWGEYACTHGTTKSVDAVASTCLTPGHDAYTRCVECGVLLSGSDADLPLADHAFDHACDVDCNVCGETRETTHDYRDTVTAPDCENSGYTVHTCTVCGDTYVDNRVDALGHSYGLTEHVPPTCAADGKKVYVCATCGDSYTEPLPATGQHTYEHSCDETCDVCGYVRDDAHDYIAHYFEEPTCGEEGCEVYKCWGLFCGNPYRYITIPATGNHTYSGECDVTCNVCDQDREPATAHTYVLTEDVAVTCTTDGKKVFTCQSCGEKHTDTIAAQGHKYTIVITKPDCENGGYTTHTCSVCGDIQVDNRVDALGHTPGAPADCENPQTCTVCGAVLKEALGHDWTDATCTAPKTCTTCGATEGEALGHIYDDDRDTDCNTCGAVREPLSIPGDLNRDGDVNNRDLVAVQQYLNNWEITVDEVAADVTGDGEINNRDLVLLQQYLNGWDVTLK